MSESRLSEMHLVVDDSGENPFARGVDDMVCVAYDIFRKFSLYDGFDKLSFDDDAPDEMFSIVYMTGCLLRRRRLISLLGVFAEPTVYF